MIKILEKINDIISCGKYYILPLWRMAVHELFLTGRALAAGKTSLALNWL